MPTVIAEPEVLRRVRWMLGGRPRVNHWGAGEVGPHPVPEMAAFFFDTGAGGDRLHGGAPETNPLPWSTGTQSSCWYQCRELGGEMYTCVSKLNVAYQLQDSAAADGGFVSATVDVCALLR